MLEKTLKSPLDCKEIQPVHSEGDQSWVFIGWTDVEAETPILWLPDVKNWLIGKDFDAGRDWGQKEKGTTEDEMAGWHHWLDGYESEWTPGVGDGQGGLACCESWGHKSRTQLSDWTELNWNNMKWGINNNTRIVGDFRTLITPVARSSRQKIKGNTSLKWQTVHQVNRIHVYRTLCLMQ